MARRVMSYAEMVESKGVAHAKDQAGKAAARKLEQAANLEAKAAELRETAVQIEAELENALRGILAAPVTGAAPIEATLAPVDVETAPETPATV